MSLLRLLTAGRSLVGLKDTTSRYRESKHRLLPEFGSSKNPFQERNPNAASEVSAAIEVPTPDPQGCVMPGGATPAQGEGTSCSATASVPSGKPRPQARGRLAHWLSLFGAGVRRRKPAKHKPSLPRLGESPVQGELSLDLVKVVRNDLNDADLEVVTAKAPLSCDGPDAVSESWAKIESGAAPSKNGKGRLSVANTQ